MTWVSWLSYNSTEISNEARTLAYLRNGLAGDPRISAGDCDCPAIDEGPYVDPQTDDAPWYTSARPESADFLGLILEAVEVSAPWARGVTARGMGGQTLGAQYLRGRTLGFRGSLFAASGQAMEYGKRWLSEVLRSGCNGCGLGDLCFLPACPDPPFDGSTVTHSEDYYEDVYTDYYEGVSTESTPDAAFDPFFRTLKSAGLIDGLTEVPYDNIPCDLLTGISFQMGTEIGYFYHPAAVCLEDSPIVAGESQCCTVSTDDWIGDATVAIRIQAGGPITVENLRVTVTPTKGDCPPDEGITPCMDVIATLPPGSELIIDGSERTVEVREVASGRLIGGYEALEFTGPFGWPDLGACTRACVCVDATDATVNPNTKISSINSYQRET